MLVDINKSLLFPEELSAISLCDILVSPLTSNVYNGDDKLIPRLLFLYTKLEEVILAILLPEPSTITG